MDFQVEIERVLKKRAASQKSGAKLLGSKLKILADLSRPLTAVDGYTFTQLMLAGLAGLVSVRAELDEINVFPIRDRDTGTNMVVSLKNSIKGLFTAPQTSVVDAAKFVAADLLLHGQDNSGTIMAHFFMKLAEAIMYASIEHGSGVQEITFRNELTVEEFALAVSKASSSMMEALPNVAEGTLISVIRDSGQGVQSDGRSLKGFVNAWCAKATAELVKTPDQLVVDGKCILRDAQVPDSGARGFVAMLEGMVKAVAGDIEFTASLTDPYLLAASSAGNALDDSAFQSTEPQVADSKYHFFAEAIFQLDAKYVKEDVAIAYKALAETGKCLDSVDVVGRQGKDGSQLIKVHFCTTYPEGAFQIAAAFAKSRRLMKEFVKDRSSKDRSANCDLSRAKFSIVCEDFGGSAPAERRLVHNLPVYAVLSSSSEPWVVGDPDNYPPIDFFQKRYAGLEDVKTAACNPHEIKCILEEVLEKESNVLCMAFGQWSSPTQSNIEAAHSQLPEDLQKRVTLYNHDYLYGPNVAFLREALRCVAQGMEVADTVERLQFVEHRVYHLFKLGYNAMKSAIKTGFVIDLYENEITTGSTFLRGCLPVPDSAPGHQDWGHEGKIGIRRSRVKMPLGCDRKTMFRPASLFGKVARCSAGEDSEDRMVDEVLEKIKAALQPQHRLKDVTFTSVGRPDKAQAVAQKFASILEGRIVGDIVVEACSLIACVFAGWDDWQLTFWIDENK